jgi:hypothetical protein
VADVLRISRDKSLLGISVGERSMRIAEVTFGADFEHRAVATEFPYPPGVSLDQPGPLGEALAALLQSRDMRTRRVIFGVPAKWLITRPYLMPPTDPQTAARALWLHASEEIPAELGPMAFDVAGQSSASKSTHLLLMGLQQNWLDRLTSLADAAKLIIAGVMPTAAAMVAASQRQSATAMTLLLHLDSAELLWTDDGHICSLRHIGSPAAVPALVAELRRATAIPEPFAPNHASPQHLLVWDEIGLEPAAFNALRDAANMPVTKADPSWAGARVVRADQNRAGFCAVSLALAARAGAGINFLHPRLQRPREKHPHGRLFWLSAAAAAALLIALAIFADLASLQHRVAAADAEYTQLVPAYAEAKTFVTNAEFAQSFQSRRPVCVACLRDLTLAVAPDDQTFFTSFSLRAELTGEVAGRSTGERNILGLVDRLNASGRFANVSLKVEPHGARESGDVNFSLTFSYVPES